MTYIGHKSVLIGGETLAEHITPVVYGECRFYNVPMPTPQQMAVVIHALRMHHTIMHAAGYDRSELAKPDELTDFYPVETSIGRFFRDAAEVTLKGEEHGR